MYTLVLVAGTCRYPALITDLRRLGLLVLLSGQYGSTLMASHFHCRIYVEVTFGFTSWQTIRTRC